MLEPTFVMHTYMLLKRTLTITGLKRLLQSRAWKRTPQQILHGRQYSERNKRVILKIMNHSLTA